jgi:drug/metabolite transporter (DMT)-like permease
MDIENNKNELLLIQQKQDGRCTDKRKRFIKGYVYNILSLISYFFTNFFSKYQLYYIPDLEVNVNQFYRSLVLLILAIIHLLATSNKVNHRESLNWSSVKHLALNSLFGHFTFIFFTLSCFYIRLGTSYTLLYTYPILAAILASLILKEKYTKIDFYGLVVGFISVCLITKFGLYEAPFGDSSGLGTYSTLLGLILGISSSISLAFEQITIKYLSHSITVEVISCFLGLFGCLYSLPFIYILRETFRYDFIFLIFSSILGITSFYGNFFLLLSFQYISLIDTLVINFVPIFFSFIFGVIFFSNSFDILDIIGSVMLIVFNIYYAKVKYRETSTTDAPVKNN